MDVFIDKMGDGGWSVRALSAAGVVSECAYLPRNEGWDRAKAEKVAELLTRVTDGIATSYYSDGYQAGKEESYRL